MTPASTTDLLGAIVAATRRSVEVRSATTSLADVTRRAETVEPRPGLFSSALSTQGRYNVIAECKRRSPSRGVLKAEYDPVRIARSYTEAGAAAISVLTEPAFFDGSLEHLAAVRQATTLPVLRKDFIVDPYQIFEARAAGADAVLLIVAAVSAKDLTHLHRVATDQGLDVLVEVHESAELDSAVEAGATIVGVNNRNLKTLAVNTDISAQVLRRIPPGVVTVAESGLKTAADLERLRGLGYSAFLMGERFMTEPDPGAALKELLVSVGPGAAPSHV